jgi:hypothetical protein
MGDMTLSPDDLRKITDMVQAQLPVPLGNPEVKDRKSSARMEFVDDLSVRGTGRSSFYYSDGLEVHVTWHYLVAGTETMVILDPEEAPDAK